MFSVEQINVGECIEICDLHSGQTLIQTNLHTKTCSSLDILVSNVPLME